jgi:hypothetical protein
MASSGGYGNLSSSRAHSPDEPATNGLGKTTEVVMNDAGVRSSLRSGAQSSNREKRDAILDAPLRRDDMLVITTNNGETTKTEKTTEINSHLFDPDHGTKLLVSLPTPRIAI